MLASTTRVHCQLDKLALGFLYIYDQTFTPIDILVCTHQSQELEIALWTDVACYCYVQVHILIRQDANKMLCSQLVRHIHISMMQNKTNYNVVQPNIYTYGKGAL
jgi:hypothetical protein